MVKAANGSITFSQWERAPFVRAHEWRSHDEAGEGLRVADVAAGASGQMSVWMRSAMSPPSLSP